VQPLLDGVKLIKKEQFIVSKASDLFFLISPSGVFFVFFLEFFCVPFFFFFFNFKFYFLFFLCLVGASVYFVVVSSVVRKSKYSFLGGIRSSRQSVSFEIVFSIYLFCFILSLGGFELKSGFFFVNFFLFFFFFFMVLAELNRAPFDFSEGESELVSGFNTEFSSITFVLLFLGEYGFLLFFSVLGGFFFFCGVFGFFFFFFLFSFFAKCFSSLSL
jgi:NADH:ubiquinone oxidoreductase subunit H